MHRATTSFVSSGQRGTQLTDNTLNSSTVAVVVAVSVVMAGKAGVTEGGPFCAPAAAGGIATMPTARACEVPPMLQQRRPQHWSVKTISVVKAPCCYVHKSGTNIFHGPQRCHCCRFRCSRDSDH